MKIILEKIKEYDTIIIHGHIRPDGDSLGSQYGLMHLIKESFPNKKVYVTGERSKYLSFLGEPEFIDENLFKNALSICVDSATDERLSDKRYTLSKYSIKIDHHLKDKEYCDYEYIDSNKSSCAEIIVEFFNLFKDELRMNKEAASALYVGILTDTGDFKHDNVTSKTLRMASILLDYNINLNEINMNLSKERVELLRFKAYCLNNFKVTENGFAYITLTKEIVNEYKVTDEEAASLVNLISNIENVYAWAMILENEYEIRIRLRSKGPNINELAIKYNGGGHKLASGAKLTSWNELETFIIDADQVVKDYKENLK